MSASNPMTKAVFTLDGHEPAYIGYTTGELWNGWATPYFPLNEAFEVMNECNKFNECAPIRFNETHDFFVYYDESIEDYIIWKGANYTTDEGIKRLYPIGAYAWVWDRIADPLYTAQDVEEFLYYYYYKMFWDEYSSHRQAIVEEVKYQLKDLEKLQKTINIMRKEFPNATDRYYALKGVLYLQL